LLLLLSASTFSVEIAKYAGEFMSTGVGARALGMGGAYVAHRGDVTYSIWNPAGLASVNYPEIAAMHSRRFGGLVNYDYFGFAMPFRAHESFGLSLVRLAVDDIPYTALPRPSLPINAQFTDENGNVLFNRTYVDKIVNNADYALYLSYAKDKSTTFSYGANVKFIRKGVGDNSAWGIGFDVGVLWNPFDKLLLGANFQDATTTLLAWNTGRQELISPTLKTGIGYPVNIPFLASRLLILGDVDTRFEGRDFASQFNAGATSLDFHVGSEILIKNIIALRIGNDIGNLTAGAGLKLPRLDIDYAFLSHDDFDVSHRISIRLRMEEPRFAR
jgi:hypothetical protein